MSTALSLLQPLLELLAQTDGWTWLRVLVAAAFYACALVAVGGVLFGQVFAHPTGPVSYTHLTLPTNREV